MERDKYLFKNTLLFTLNEVGTRLVTFFLVPIYTTSLSTGEYGITDLGSKLVNLLVPIITLNIKESIMRFSLDKEADHRKIMSIGLISVFFELLLGLVVFPLAGIFSELDEFRLLIFICCISSGIYQLLISFLRGKEKLREYAICNILHILVISISNIIFLIYYRTGIKGYFWSIILSDIIVSIISAFVGDVFDVVINISVDLPLLKSMLQFSIPMIPSSLSWWIMNYFDSTMVTKMLGSEANGIYAASYKLPTIVSVLSNVFNRAWTYSAIREDSSEDSTEYNNNMFSRFLSFQVIVTGFLLLIIKPFTPIYVRKEAYFVSWKYAPFLIIGNFFLSIGTFLSTYYTVNKDSKHYLYSSMVGAIINLILNFFLIPRIGLFGAAISTAFSYFCVFVYRVKDTKKYVSLVYITPKRVVSLLVLVGMCFVMYQNYKMEMLILFGLFVIIVVMEREFIISVLFMVIKIIKHIFHK